METKLEALIWWRVFRAQQKQRCIFACFSYAKQRRSVVKLSLDNSIIKTALPNSLIYLIPNLSSNTEGRQNKEENYLL